MLQVLVEVLTKDEDIIKVYSHALVQQVLERQIHQALEGGRSIGRVKKPKTGFLPKPNVESEGVSISKA